MTGCEEWLSGALVVELPDGLVVGSARNPATEK